MSTIFRLSQQLARKVKVHPLSELTLADDPLTDWSAHAFNVSRKGYIIVSNTRSLYSAVMDARGVNEPNVLVGGALRTLADVMEADGLLAAYQQHSLPQRGMVRFGKAINRSVTGSMNELIVLAKILLAEDGNSPRDVGLHLNDTLLSVLAGQDGKSYDKPRDVMRALIGGGR